MFEFCTAYLSSLAKILLKRMFGATIAFSFLGIDGTILISLASIKQKLGFRHRKYWRTAVIFSDKRSD
jgi:hypothetical protein